MDSINEPTCIDLDMYSGETTVAGVEEVVRLLKSNISPGIE